MSYEAFVFVWTFGFGLERSVRAMVLGVFSFTLP